MTITSNIHPNLASWTAATYLVGNRRSNAGNAYQCTFPGISTGAPTGTGSNINNGGAAVWKWLSAIDFTSLQAWWNSQPATLTDNIFAAAWNNGTFTVTAGTMLLDGNANTVTTGSFTVTVGCAPGESVRDTRGAGVALAFNAANGVSFTAPATGTPGAYFNGAFNNFILDGWQIKDSQANYTNTLLLAQGSCTIQNCLVDCSSGDIFYSNSSNGKLINCVLIDRSTSNPPVQWDTAATGGAAINCLLIAVNGNTTAGGGYYGRSGTGSVILRNSIAFGYTIPVQSGLSAGAIAVDHCCFDVADFSASSFTVTDNGGNLFSKTAANQFVSATTDFRLKPGADCLNTGVADATDIPTTDDIYRTFRPQVSPFWDIGPNERRGSIPYHPAVQMAPQQAS